MPHVISEEDGDLVPQLREEAERSFPTGDCDLYNASSLNDFHLHELCVSFSCFPQCEV